MAALKFFLLFALAATCVLGVAGLPAPDGEESSKTIITTVEKHHHHHHHKSHHEDEEIIKEGTPSRSGSASASSASASSSGFRRSGSSSSASASASISKSKSFSDSGFEILDLGLWLTAGINFLTDAGAIILETFLLKWKAVAVALEALWAKILVLWEALVLLVSALVGKTLIADVVAVWTAEFGALVSLPKLIGLFEALLLALKEFAIL